MVSRRGSGSLRPKIISVAVASCFVAGAALANPTNPTVVNGNATFNQVGNVLKITNTPNAVINWQSFSIGANEITRFIQQSQSSAVLNRVVGTNGTIPESVILGAMTSNGRVFLINSSGILFGAGSRVDVGGVVATSLNLSNADFQANRMRFTEVAGAGAVRNFGNINTAPGGNVYLVGPAVTNNGIIASPNGEVILAAGNRVELVNPGTPNLRVEITAAENAAVNLGRIVADSGRVGIYAGIVNQAGMIRANGAAVTEDGRIVLKATKDVVVEAGSVTKANGRDGGDITIQSGDTTIVAGTVEAKGYRGEGGSVKVLGNLVGLTGNASIDVSGDTGGGTVLVGGDFQGGNSQVPNAFRTYVGPGVTINADAITEGDGGKIIVWADDATRFYGSISARGGAEGGNGGFAEVSGKDYLEYRGLANLSAPKGRHGTLLLDPNDVEIITGADTPAGGGVFDEGNPNIFSTPGTADSTVTWGTIKANLASGNVYITTDGGGALDGIITISADSPNLASANTLKLMAHNDINVGGSITNTGNAGSIELYAGWNANTSSPGVNGGVGSINIDLDKSIKTGGSITLAAGGTINLGLSNSQVEAGGDVLLKARDGMNLAGTGNLVKGANITMQVMNDLLIDTVAGDGPLTLRPSDLNVLALNDPASGKLSIEAQHIDINAPVTFNPAKVQTLALKAFSLSSILQQPEAPLSVKNLLAESNGVVSMTADNDVDKVAGSSTNGLFEFRNAHALTIGSVAGTSGITVTGSDAIVDVSTASGSLTVNQPVTATASFGDAFVNLTGAGNLVVNNLAKAQSTGGFGAYGGGVNVISENGAVQVGSGGSILAQGNNAYGGIAGILIDAATGVTLDGSLTAQGGTHSFGGTGGDAGIAVNANGGAVSVNGPISATAGGGEIPGMAAVGIQASGNVVLNGNITTEGSGGGIGIIAGNAIVGGNGILNAIQTSGGDFPTIELHAVNGIGTPAKPVRLQDGGSNGPNLFLNNTGSQGDLAVSFVAGDVLIDGAGSGLLGTYNNNPNGTYFIKAEEGDIILAAPFKPGIEVPENLKPGQSVTLKASGDVYLETVSGPPPGIFIPSSGSIVTSGSGQIKIDAGASIQTDEGTSLTSASAINLDAGGTINTHGSISGAAVNLTTATQMDNSGSISGSTINLNAGGHIGNIGSISGSVVNLTAGSAIGNSGAISGPDIQLTAGTTITSTGPLTGGPVNATAGGNITLSQAQSISLGLLKSTSGGVLVDSGGAITDGNGDLNNVEAISAALFGVSGVGADKSLNTKVTNLIGETTSGDFNVSNTGALFLNGLNVGGNSEIKSTALMQVPGHVSVSGNLALLSDNGILIGSPSPEHHVSVGGNLIANSGIGDMGFIGTSVTATNIDLSGKTIQVGSGESELPTTVVASNVFTATTTQNFNVIGGNGPSAHSFVQGVDVNLTVGTEAGVINIAAGADGATAQIRASSPDTITLTFPNLDSGSSGWYVNSVEGAIVDAAGSSGFFANGAPAVPGSSLKVTYGKTVTLPPAVEEEAQNVGNEIINTTNNQTDNTTFPSDDDQKTIVIVDTTRPGADKNKKELPVCK